MIRVHAEVVRSTNSAVEDRHNKWRPCTVTPSVGVWARLLLLFHRQPLKKFIFCVCMEENTEETDFGMEFVRNIFYNQN